MRQVYISEKNLTNKDEIENVIAEHSQILKEIDNNVRMWVVERKCKNLWDIALNEGKVIDPSDKSAIKPDADVKHIVLVTSTNSQEKEIVFGNKEEKFIDFFQTVLKDVSSRYPNH